MLNAIFKKRRMHINANIGVIFIPVHRVDPEVLLEGKKHSYFSVMGRHNQAQHCWLF